MYKHEAGKIPKIEAWKVDVLQDVNESIHKIST